jgi:hypothetical protein
MKKTFGFSLSFVMDCGILIETYSAPYQEKQQYGTSSWKSRADTSFEHLSVQEEARLTVKCPSQSLSMVWVM